MSVAESALPGIEADRVGRWLAEHVDGLVGPVEFRLVSGGRSNLTYRLTDAAGVTYALRRPPTGGVLSTAHDVSREWRFISALAPTTVPVPQPVAYCADTAVTGAEFYVMGFVDGLVLADSDAGLTLALQARAGAAEYWVAFSRWRSACTGVGVRARYLAGHMADDGFAARLLTSAEPGAAGSRVVLAEAARDALRAADL